MPKRKGFDDDEDDLLVHLVSQYRLLYDNKHRDYRNVRLKNTAWEKIGEALEKEGNHCKMRWKDIRDNYWKIIRKEKLSSESGLPPTSKKWSLFDKLTFLGDYERDPQPSPFFNNIQEPISGNIEVIIADDKDGLMEVEHDISPSFSSASESRSISPSFAVHRSRKRSWDVINKRNKKKLALLKRFCEYDERQVDDDVDLFMKSIALSVKKLPPQLINKAKIGILKFVSDLSESSSKTIIVDKHS